MKIAIVGGGIGGLAAAIALLKFDHNVTVFEQAALFGRVGADVNLTPNAVLALDGLGVGDAIRQTAAQPTHRISRLWDTGQITSTIEMAETAIKTYGAPQLTIHRADVLTALESGLPDGVVRHGHRVTGCTATQQCPSISFADGTSETFDMVIGADGIHSIIRTALFGPESAQFTGVVAYRAVVPRARLAVPNLDAFTKWWGPDPTSQIVTFPLNRGSETFVFATAAQEDWRHESWTRPGDLGTIRPLYDAFHIEGRALLAACDSMMASALYIREPLAQWSSGHVTLLGDACHPMMPFMAQGACQAIEDAVVLARCLTEVVSDDVPKALQVYESIRQERTARIQIGSRGNAWLREGSNADWVYGYDAWAVSVARSARSKLT